MAVTADNTSMSRRALIGALTVPFLPAAAALANAASSERAIDVLWREHLAVCQMQLETDRLGNELGRSDDEFYEVSSNAYFASRDAIDALPYSPEALVAKVLLAAIAHGYVYDTIRDKIVLRIVIEGLRPSISGPVAETVDDFLNDPGRPFAYSPLWGSVVEPGKTATEMYIAHYEERPA